jgi:DNA (cytosine-5)-methyltransferase 1
MQAYFKRIGYELHYTIQNSADFGVLQKRKRIILIGWQQNSGFSYPEFEKENKNWKVNDLLNDLKKLKPGEQKLLQF